MISTANFFWQGIFGVYEKACISSFLKNNFKVQVFSYQNDMKIPAGAVLRDARDILPEKMLYTFDQSEQKGCMPGFANAFRYHLLKKEGGWWFDADLICLRDANIFMETIRAKPKPVAVGRQDAKYINNAVIYSEDECFVDAVLMQLKKNGNVVEWGDNGPRLITKVVNDLGYQDIVDPCERYYPVNGNDLMNLYDPEFRDWCVLKTGNALTVHLWNEIIRRLCIPKNVLPPDGSFLKDKILEICPELANYPSLPFNTIKRLIEYNIIKSEIERMKKNPVDHVKDISRKVKSKVKKIIKSI